MTLTLRASRVLEIPGSMEAVLCYGRGPALPPPQVRADTTEGDGWGVALDVAALNDVVLEKLARDRQVSVGVYLAGRRLASYSADAFAVATPTGSTAYSFAAAWSRALPAHGRGRLHSHRAPHDLQPQRRRRAGRTRRPAGAAPLGPGGRQHRRPVARGARPRRLDRGLPGSAAGPSDPPAPHRLLR